MASTKSGVYNTVDRRGVLYGFDIRITILCQHLQVINQAIRSIPCDYEQVRLKNIVDGEEPKF